jgi:HTH-type transcriptional regulator / antitoxin HigA
MELRPIKSKRDYANALKQVETLWNARPGSVDADRLDVLTLLIQAYEATHFPIPDPDPVDLLLHVMEARQLTRKHMEKYIGTRARVAEILNRQRPLTLEMVRRLSSGLNLPAEILIQPYGLRAA